MDWFRKLGHGRWTAEPTTGRTAELEKPVKETSFRHQASLGIRGTSSAKRKQQVMTTDTGRRRSAHLHRGSSIKSSSIRSSRPTPPFSPPRTTPNNRYPRAATFMTRSDASPGSSFISSTLSRRSSAAETEHSLAGSYLDVDDPDSRSFVPDPDSRSFVPSVMADEDASLRPFPPSPNRRSSTPRSMSSIDGMRLGGRQSVRSHGGTSPLPPFTRRNSQSTTTTHSSFGAHSRTWTNDASRGTPRSVDTRPTTIISSLDLPQRVAHIAQVPPPQVALSLRPHVAGIHRTLTWDSGLSASPSVPSPLGTTVVPPPRSILERTSPPPSPTQASSGYPCNVPRHSHPHPRDNPRPFARPEENASLVTLASSEFAQPGILRSEGGASIVASSERREPSPSRDLLGPPLVVQGMSGRYGTPDPDEDEGYAEQTPMMGAYPSGEASSSRRRTLSYFDRASSTYYFTGAPNGGGSILTSSLHAGGGGHLNHSIRSHDDRSGGVDDRASVTAVRRRGSWESGESSFSGAGVGAGARGSYSVASQHVHYEPSFTQLGGAGDGAGLTQSLGRLSVFERGGGDGRLGEVM